MRSERHVATPDCHTLQRVNWARLFLFLPAIKIEIENSLEMALSEAKSSGAWQSHFWQCGTLRLLKMTHKMPSYISCLRAGSDLTSLCFGCGFGFVFVLCVFCSGLLCWFCFVVCFFCWDRSWTVYRSSPVLAWPFGVFFGVLFLCFVLSHSQNDTGDVIMHVIS